MNDTICAISTPPGIGGIATARVSGRDAIDITQQIWKGRRLSEVATHTAHLGTILDREGKDLDQAVVIVFRSPHSFTGENVVEITVHGSRFVQRELLSSLTAAGARMAEPGEFTRRAFTSGRLDLAQAEAVADVIASNSRSSHRIAMTQMRGGVSRRLDELRQKLIDLSSLLELELDFSEEEVEFADRQQLIDLAEKIHREVSRLHDSFHTGHAIKEGIPVAIIGATNAGKSSLLNTLLDDDRAIVSDIHGTTRDTIEETLEIGDYLFRFIDTAGLRDTTDTIEQIGIQRSLDAINKARIAICVIDPGSPVDLQILSHAATPLYSKPTAGHLIVAINKSDITDQTAIDKALGQIPQEITSDKNVTTIGISALTGNGIEALRTALRDIASQQDESKDHEGILISNARHAAALAAAAESSGRTIQALKDNIPGDLVAQDLRETIHHLASITGDIPSTEILSTIFSRFCIGK